MKLTQGQLRSVINQVISEAKKKAPKKKSVSDKAPSWTDEKERQYKAKMKKAKAKKAATKKKVVKEAIDDPNDTRFEDVSPLAHEVNLYETLGNLFTVLEEKFGKGNPEIAKWMHELVNDGVESTISDYDGQDEVMMTGFGQDDYDHSEKD